MMWISWGVRGIALLLLRDRVDKRAFLTGGGGGHGKEREFCLLMWLFDADQTRPVPMDLLRLLLALSVHPALLFH